MYTDSDQPFRGMRGQINEFKKMTLDIKEWSDNIVDAHVDNIKTECPWFDKIIEAAIVSLVQIMSSVKINKNSNKIQLNVPSAADFVRKCYRTSQTEIYKSADFMSDDEHRETILVNKLTKVIDNVVRSYVPLHNIIAMNISEAQPYENEPIEEEQSPVEEEEEDDVLIPDAAEKKIDIM
jgi:Fe2+ transport system protein B